MSTIITGSDTDSGLPSIPVRPCHRRPGPSWPVMPRMTACGEIHGPPDASNHHVSWGHIRLIGLRPNASRYLGHHN